MPPCGVHMRRQKMMVSGIVVLLVLLAIISAACQNFFEEKQAPSAKNLSKMRLPGKALPPQEKPPKPSPRSQQWRQPERLGGTPCYAVIPGHNQADADRVNLVFVGFNVGRQNFTDFLPHFVDIDGAGLTVTIPHNFKMYTESGELVRLPPGSRQTFYGFFSTEPFAQNRNKFNFWYVDEIQQVTVPRDPTKARVAGCNVRCASDVERQCGLKNDYTVNVCNAACTPTASEYTREVFIGDLNPYQVRTLIHEFAHSFAGIKDEYTKDGMGDRPGYPNCAPSHVIAEQWWGDLVGQGNGVLEVGFFNGCSYTDDNIRPTESSLMRGNHFLGLGLVNERHIQELLNYFSGEYAARIEDKNMTEISLQLRARREGR